MNAFPISGSARRKRPPVCGSPLFRLGTRTQTKTIFLMSLYHTRNTQTKTFAQSQNIHGQDPFFSYSPVLRRNNSQNAGCMRACAFSVSSSSQEYQTSFVVCTNAPASVCVSPHSARASRISAGLGGSSRITGFRSIALRPTAAPSVLDCKKSAEADSSQDIHVIVVGGRVAGRSSSRFLTLRKAQCVLNFVVNHCDFGFVGERIDRDGFENFRAINFRFKRLN